MKVLVNLYSWENSRLCDADNELAVGDKVIVEGEFGNELGIVAANNVESSEKPIQSVLRKALTRDIKAFESNQSKKGAIMKICRQETKKLNLAIKIIDIIISLDSRNITVIFSAEERVDFRELVKRLTGLLRCSVRMHQIGSRDEARRRGGCGVCGRELCCVNLLKNIPSISIETARNQQIAHRGSERISGQCGRLLCCLVYEAAQYQELLKDMPKIGNKIKTKEGVGEVVEINPFSRQVKVRLEKGRIIILKKEDI